MKKLIARLLLTLSLISPAPVLMTVGVTSVAITQTACDKDKIREARKAAYRIQVVLDAAIDTTGTLHREGVLSNEQTNKIAKILLKINQGNAVLIERAAAATEDSPAVRSSLLEQVKVIKDALKELKDAGVLSIKSANGELAFNSAITALESAIAILETALRVK